MLWKQLLCLIGSGRDWLRPQVIGSNVEGSKSYFARDLLMSAGGFRKRLDLICNGDDTASRE